MEWQPIETAPKDGTKFIAYKKPDVMCNFPIWVIAKYVSRYELHPFGQCYDEDHEHDEEMQSFEIKSLVTTWNHKCIADTGFTHWQPLPEAPNVKDQGPPNGGPAGS